MTPGSRPTRRSVAGSRNPTSRPRTVAGRGGARPDPGEPGAEAPAEPDEPAYVEPVRDEPVADRPKAAPRLLAGARTTLALVVAVVLLVAALAAEGWYLWLKPDPVVSAQRPVVVGEIAHRAAVEAAQQSITEILSYGYRDYDAQIDEAASKMTDEFAARFRKTAGDVRGGFVEGRTEQQVKVVAASVVQASADQVQALLFLNQYVTKPGEGTSVSPFRALVTMVHTDSGWLVSDIETA